MGSSYYTGVSNIFRFDVETQEISALSNSLTGLFRPTFIDDEKIFAFNFRSDGFQPVYIPNAEITDLSNISFLGNITVEKHPILEDWQLPIPSAQDIDIDELIIKEEKYKATKEMRIKYAYPIVVGYKNNVGLGYRFNIADPFNFKTLDFSVSFTPRTWENTLLADRDASFVSLEDNELFHASMNFKSGNFTTFASFNEAAFHDLFGPSQGSRKGARLGVQYDKTFIYDPPRVLNFNASITGFYGLDQSPEYQQILVAGYNRNLFVNLSASLGYSSSRSSLGAVDSEKGLQANLYSSVASSAGKVYPRVIGMLNYGIPLPAKHFSLWLRSAGGTSFSDAFNPFTRFGFGAFGNNYIDYQSTRQYRAPFAFPGVSFTNDRVIIAQRFVKGTAELVIPPWRFKKVGGFNFFANWLQPTLFSSVLYSTSAEGFENQLVNFGGQVDLRMVTFSLLPSTLSFGYARAWDINGPGQYDEWMISLKLLH
jgi:hypothetical protein